MAVYRLIISVCRCLFTGLLVAHSRALASVRDSLRSSIQAPIFGARVNFTLSFFFFFFINTSQKLYDTLKRKIHDFFLNLGRWKGNMSYVVFRLTRNTFWRMDRFCERWRNLHKTGSDQPLKHYLFLTFKSSSGIQGGWSDRVRSRFCLCLDFVACFRRKAKAYLLKQTKPKNHIPIFKDLRVVTSSDLYTWAFYTLPYLK